MKIFIFYSIKNKISREEYEVRETAKSFIYNENNGTTKHFYKKDLNILKIDYNNTYRMLSLSGNPEKFIKFVIREKENLIKEYKLKSNQIANEIDYLKNEYAQILSSHTDKYIVNGFLFFAHKGTSVCGNRQLYENNIEIELSNLVSGEDFLIALKDGTFNPLKIAILNVFINGYQSNIGLETFTNEILDPCIVSIEKFSDIVLGAKVEIDIKLKEDKEI